jgi:transcriptional regulator with PAS, ATPase and Fis domain
MIPTRMSARFRPHEARALTVGGQDHGGGATESMVAAHDSPLQVSRFKLVVAEGPDRGATLVSDSDRVVIGTHESAGLVLTDPTVSRFHCELVAASDHVTLRDLDSKNGTTISDVQVGSARLAPGSTIGVGRTRVRFVTIDQTVPLAISERSGVGVMVGQSLAMRHVFALIERAAASDASVLLEGETGTGKEAAAESIHRESARRDGPFLVLDCGAIPRELLESELFGHERGAFSGAVSARTGVFEAARGGTILLDELGELPLELQPKLLGVLERREVRPVGSNRTIPVDVRVIAATNRSLAGEVNAHRFRADLYYRLAVLEINMPPLRQRREDLPTLVEHLATCRGWALPAWMTTPAFIVELANHHWPGNVRELRNYLERCIAIGERPGLPSATTTPSPASSMASDAPIDFGVPLKAAREAVLAPFERRYLEASLRHHDNNVSAAARTAGIDRLGFYRLLWRHGLR